MSDLPGQHSRALLRTTDLTEGLLRLQNHSPDIKELPDHSEDEGSTHEPGSVVLACKAWPNSFHGNSSISRDLVRPH